MLIKLKYIFIINYVLKIPRRFLPWLLYFLTFLTLQESTKISVFGQSCSNLKFPLTLGFPSGETEINSIDQDSSTGFLYIAGTTTTTELKVSGALKSVFIAMFTGSEYLWIIRIENALVDTFEFMSAMGNSSQNLILYATKSSSPYIPIISIISKTDGSIVRTFEINNSKIGKINPPSK